MPGICFDAELCSATNRPLGPLQSVLKQSIDQMRYNGTQQLKLIWSWMACVVYFYFDKGHHHALMSCGLCNIWRSISTESPLPNKNSGAQRQGDIYPQYHFHHHFADRLAQETDVADIQQMYIFVINSCCTCFLNWEQLRCISNCVLWFLHSGTNPHRKQSKQQHQHQAHFNLANLTDRWHSSGKISQIHCDI